MGSVFLGDSAWQSTFPHRVAPSHEEWLAGLLLRCDEANRWGGGTTIVYLYRRYCSFQRNRWLTLPYMFVTPLSMITDLAHVLALPENILLLTTYQTELCRIYNTPTPPGLLLNKNLFRFHFCPECIAQNRTLKRAITLAHVTICPQHQVSFTRKCICGSIQQLYTRQIAPFTGPTCYKDWSQLPRIYAKQEQIAQEQKLLALYDLFFTQGTPNLLANALKLSKERLFGPRKKYYRNLRRLDGSVILRSTVEPRPPRRVCLCNLVDVLFTLEITPNDLLASSNFGLPDEK